MLEEHFSSLTKKENLKNFSKTDFLRYLGQDSRLQTQALNHSMQYR